MEKLQSSIIRVSIIVHDLFSWHLTTCYESSINTQYMFELHSQHKLSSMHDKCSLDDMYALMYELVTSFDVWSLYCIINNVALASNKQQSKWMSFFFRSQSRLARVALTVNFVYEKKTFSSQNTLEKAENWMSRARESVRERVLGGIRSSKNNQYSRENLYNTKISFFLSSLYICLCLNIRRVHTAGRWSSESKSSLWADDDDLAWIFWLAFFLFAHVVLGIRVENRN